MVRQIILNGFVLGATISLMAIGFTLIFGILRVVNFWHGEAYMFGAVLIFFLRQEAGLNYVLAVAISVVAVAALGLLSDQTIMRRFRGDMMGGVIATIALYLLFQNVMWYILGGRPRGVSPVLTDNVTVLGTHISAGRLIVVIVSFIAIAALGLFINRTRLGKMMRAVQQDREAAQIQGINANRIYGMTFAIATGLAALAGALIAPIYTVTPVMGGGPLMLTFIVVIVGGLGSISGAFIASFIIGFQQSFTAAYWGSEFSLAVSFGLALLILLVLPRGLRGQE